LKRTVLVRSIQFTVCATSMQSTHYAIGVGVFEVAGTSVQIIQEYYGKQATPTVFATRLGDFEYSA
jgi:hypothetical protein